MFYKFERLEVWQLAMEYTDVLDAIARQLPPSEDFNLRSQIIRAGTSISLNIAEGSTSQSNAEQARFLGMSIRSLIETVACQHMIHRRQYLKSPDLLREAYQQSKPLFIKLQSFRSSLIPKSGTSLREEAEEYTIAAECPF
jgi:four helix bundle protein